MSDAIKAGDRVRLKSGGPELTVKNMSDDGKFARCQWFAGNTVEEKSFSVIVLEKVELGRAGTWGRAAAIGSEDE